VTYTIVNEPVPHIPLTGRLSLRYLGDRRFILVRPSYDSIKVLAYFSRVDATDYLLSAAYHPEGKFMSSLLSDCARILDELAQRKAIK
jgi:hypothetical protein